MSGNSFGTIFRITTFGESHGPAIGVVIDGVPAGLPLEPEDITAEMRRRRPGQSTISTPRDEKDEVEILSGIFENMTTGTPLAMLIRNYDARSSDYDKLADVFRPGHADYTYFAKYGLRDHRGGGRSSGRETAARVAAGAVAKILLKTKQIEIIAHTLQIGEVRGESFDSAQIERNMARSADIVAADRMIEAIQKAASSGDSIGGVVECRIKNVPAGWGEPVFHKLDALLAMAMLSIGGVKGIEFGSGFAAARMRGSENNDNFASGAYLSNNSGGISGGISNGDEIIFRLAVKPTPSIGIAQQARNAVGESVECEITGRHDPCLCPRLVPVVESMAAIVLADLYLLNKTNKV